MLRSMVYSVITFLIMSVSSTHANPKDLADMIIQKLQQLDREFSDLEESITFRNDRAREKYGDLVWSIGDIEELVEDLKKKMNTPGELPLRAAQLMGEVNVLKSVIEAYVDGDGRKPYLVEEPWDPISIQLPKRFNARVLVQGLRGSRIRGNNFEIPAEANEDNRYLDLFDDARIMFIRSLKDLAFEANSERLKDEVNRLAIWGYEFEHKLTRRSQVQRLVPKADIDDLRRIIED